MSSQAANSSTERNEHDVAVIGMACRLPMASNPSAFWRLLRDGRDAITDIPENRWKPDSLPFQENEIPRRGGFLEDIDGFDSRFFSTSPREAAAMDPQQRLVLELSWEALEDARIVPADLDGTRAGVFIGAMGDDYSALAHGGGVGAITSHTLTGLSRGLIANRVSYTLGLRGPSLTVDSAQSSALAAVHLACASLHSGEATIALAGGVNLILAPESTVGAARFGALSPDGRCYTFDARANGYVRGEGGGLVVLKPLAEALADGDTVYCVIRGSALGNDGTTSSLTIPAQEAQEEALRQAYRRAGVEPSEVQYVELHGTGTRVGDPIEAAALGAVVGARKPEGSPLLVGSAKTNVGHLEGAAGIVGLLKTALSIRHRALPASLNFATPNPEIPLDRLNLRVQQELTPWPDEDRPLVAGVSSFGMGGTNCHVVLGEGPVGGSGETGAPAGVSFEGPSVWLVSGKSPEALADQAAQLHAFATDRPEVDVR
ncbi:type I polyketide synthase, partial [Kitasatospora sp. NPDC057500]|uniref:type I polyketide synthase n=1 Tax=Kitasatospora sp. NPDC057500 TaxID=3346151 RepID=UPI0036A6592D